MGTVSLDDVQVTSLARIPVEGGDVMHAMKVSDVGYNGFGEAYFSWVGRGVVKAWKLHQHMTLNLVVPVGEVRFVFCTPVIQSTFREERIGGAQYARLSVPPGIWFGFQGLAESQSLVLNIADIEHDPNETLKKEPNEIHFDWNLG
jgi:dTDP-4-dehydrorhamnose 3,5-epimerase